MGVNGYKELRVWQKAKDLSVDLYKLTNSGSFTKDFGLRDQMRRASVSIASNIAEGDERSSDKESIRFLHIAKGSLAELRTQIQISHEIGYITPEIYGDFDGACEEIGRMLGSLIKARQGIR